MARFAQEVVKPKVAEMDEKEYMDKSILNGLFEQGVGHQKDRYRGERRCNWDIFFLFPS